MILVELMMKTGLVRLAAIFCALALAACASMPETMAPEAQTDEPIVLLIGLDGLHPDMIDRYDAPNIRALAARGVRAEAMIPVMPTVTFTNFYTLATGLYPENHGIVTNAPWDREFREGFVNATSTQESRWWDGEPIWITAERQGLVSSVMFWLGSEVDFDGVRPTRWTPYDHDKPYDERVTEVLGWFDAPEDTRPRFVAVYFDRVDSAGHFYGPDAPQTAAAVAEVDALVGELAAGLEARGLLDRTNIIIVSDHGMAEVDFDQVIAIDDFIDLDAVFVPEVAGRYRGGRSTFVQVFGEAEAVEAAYQALDGAHPHLRVWRRGETPERFRFDHPTRGPDLFVLADPGWTIHAPSLPAPPRTPIPGMHGYDNADPSMAASFVAAGPAFPEGVTVEAFESVNVYLMMACALGLDPAPTDADPQVVARVTGGRCPAQ